MRIYSTTTVSFIKRLRKYSRQILKEIFHLEVRRTRFLFNGYLYPFEIVVFEGKELGYFNHHNYLIGINKSLMFSAKTSVIKEILTHEFAHYMAYLHYGEKQKPHGEGFKNIFQKYSIPNHIAKATANIDSLNLNIEGDLASERVIEKVKKLLSLAQSQNQHESELATMKANQLLLKHNLSLLDHNEREEEACVLPVLTYSRSNAKLRCISDILSTFYVFPVANHGKKQVVLEVTGSRTNVEIAQYVASYLDIELEELWKKTKKENPGLRNLNARNSFFRGVAKGYQDKINEAKLSLNVDQKALVRIESKLQEYVDMSYGRLSARSYRTGNDCNKANSLGRSTGRNLTIARGLKSNNNSKLLDY